MSDKAEVTRLQLFAKLLGTASPATVENLAGLFDRAIRDVVREELAKLILHVECRDGGVGVELRHERPGDGAHPKFPQYVELTSDFYSLTR